MKSPAMSFVVNLFYQTPAGNPSGRRYRVDGVDSHEAAEAIAAGKLRKSLPGVKIHGGDSEQIPSEQVA